MKTFVKVAQFLNSSYQKPKGILINFHCVNIFKEGQRTLVNNLFTLLPEA
jgi:hypothetical protein